MLYPSIHELLATSAKDGEEKLNKYSVVMATAKCARVITNEYVEQRYIAEKKIANKETERDLASLINKEYRDEKAVKNAIREMKEGKFEVFLPNEEGYEDSIVDVPDYEEPVEEYKPFKQILAGKAEETVATPTIFEDFNSEELMGAEEVITNEQGYAIRESDDETVL